MKIEINEQELQVLLSVLDAGVKTLGLNSVIPIANLLVKLNNAKQNAEKE